MIAAARLSRSSVVVALLDQLVAVGLVETRDGAAADQLHAARSRADGPTDRSGAPAVPAIADLTAARGGHRAHGALAPLLLCVGAGCIIAFAPLMVWRLETGDWVCLNDWFAPYYMRFAAQAYYHHLFYISDVAAPGGVTGYPWLTFVPAIWLARALAAGPFAVNIIWIFLSAIGLSVTLYFGFAYFLDSRWVAAGATLFCLSDYGFAAARPLTAQLRILASALWRRPAGPVDIPWGLLLQWRVPDPALDLPFMFIQIVAVARARSHPTRRNVVLSGLAFGLLFYVFFYCWTMAAAGLAIAFVLDRGARRVYAATLGIGILAGLPELIYSIHVNSLASPEAMRRFGLFTPAPRLYEVTVPAVSLLAVGAAGWWIRKSGRLDLVYIWSLVAGGMLLSRSRIVTGIFFHEYHYSWLWTPARMVLVLIVVLSIACARFRLRPAAVGICWTVLLLYFAGGVYVAAISVMRTRSGVEEVENYTRYRAQRLDAPASPLAAGATIAGDEAFCELAAVAEDQWVLGGAAVARSMAVDNGQWESRLALNAYLSGMSRADFERAARSITEDWFWETPQRQPGIIGDFMRKYDAIARTPDRYVAEFNVHYLALATDRAGKANPGAGWAILQHGPYWQIWQWVKPVS